MGLGIDTTFEWKGRGVDGGEEEGDIFKIKGILDQRGDYSIPHPSDEQYHDRTWTISPNETVRLSS